jgi:hypothetical protein
LSVLGEPAAHEIEGDVAVARVDVGEVLEHRGLDRVEQAPDLNAGLLVAAGGTRLRRGRGGPTAREAGEVGVAG